MLLTQKAWKSFSNYFQGLIERFILSMDRCFIFMLQEELKNLKLLNFSCQIILE